MCNVKTNNCTRVMPYMENGVLNITNQAHRNDTHIE